MKTLVEYIKDSLLQHIAIELQDNDIIYEKYGVYNGCEDLTNYIIDKISKLKSYDDEIQIKYSDVQNIDNIVFEVMLIRFTKAQKPSGSYISYSEQELDFFSKRFNEVHIQINFDIDKIGTQRSELKSIIEHELTHLYNDFLITSVGPSKFVELFSSLEYQRSKQFVRNNWPTSLRKFLRALYMLNGYEINGFVASIMSQIEDIKKENIIKEKPLTVNEIYVEVQKLEIYKVYKEIIEYIQLYKQQDLYRKEKDEICTFWKDNFNENVNIDQLFKKLSVKVDKLKRKLESVVPKKIAERLDFGFNKTVLD